MTEPLDMTLGPAEKPARDSDYDWACASCFTEWDGDPECPGCGTLAVVVGSRVALRGEGPWVGVVTAIRELNTIVVVKWDTGVTERCLPDELRKEET